MSGDYSRKRFNPEKHYQGVLRQQGRVDLDADWNEYVDLQDRHWRAESIDAIGRCGVSFQTPDGFKIQIAASQLMIGQGRIYVDGLLAENHGANSQFNSTLEENYGTAPIPVTEQPYGGGTIEVPENVRSLVYLDVWRREVTHLQDPQLIESAVNIDTMTRYQTAWQVKLLDDIDSGVNCQTDLADIAKWRQENLPTSARLTTSTVAVTTGSDLCLVPPSGGYRGLENHLYRVEVHDVASTGEVWVKWSRDNAHVGSEIVEVLTDQPGVKVASLGHDDTLRFNIGDWVEITSDKREFEGRAGDMRMITGIDTDLTLTFTGALSGDLEVAHHLRVNRWDQIGNDLTSDGLIELTASKPSFVLEHGIRVELSVPAGGSARVGDYWCFAARTADADIERLDQAPPEGLHHHYCKLAIIEANGDVVDCRPVFPALTEMVSLFYVSGDGQEGQEALQGQALPKPIQVGLANGKRPVVGAAVRFHVKGGNGNLTAGTSSGIDINVVTDSLGVASCVWTLDGANQSQQVEAMLADGSHLPVRFNATLSQPGGAEPGIHVQKISLGGKALGNDTEVTVAELASGIIITCDENPFHGSVFNKPVCFVTVELPFQWKTDIVGFQPLILAADVNSELGSIFWQATTETKSWLETWPFKSDQKRGDRLLARLTLKGNFIWSEKDPNLYLDGEFFGEQAAGQVITAVKFPSGDGRRGGDLEMWFWLVEGKAIDVTVTIKPTTASVALGKQVDFAVIVEGTTDKLVEMKLDPPGAGTIKQSIANPEAWTYTAPQTIPLINPVRIVAKSIADPTKTATAEALVLQGQQDIAIAIAPLKEELAPLGQKDFTVTVQGGDVAKVEMHVNGVVNGNLKVGTLTPAPQKGLGVWIYTAPQTVPTPNVMNIVATSQEDTTKSATAQVTIQSSNPKLGPTGSTNPTTGENEGGTGSSESKKPDRGSRPTPVRRPRRPRT